MFWVYLALVGFIVAAVAEKKGQRLIFCIGLAMPVSSIVASFFYNWKVALILTAILVGAFIKVLYFD